MITIIMGPMMARKSTELLRYLERGVIGKKNVCLIRPMTDTRNFFSHSQGTQSIYDSLDIPTFYVNDHDNKLYLWDKSYKCIDELLKYDIIGIDECQFIDNLKEIIVSILEEKYSIDFYIAGLLATSECQVFEPIIDILPYCDQIIKLNAVCSQCGNDVANYTFYKEGIKNNDVEIGGDDKYEARCYKCYSFKS